MATAAFDLELGANSVLFSCPAGVREGIETPKARYVKTLPFRSRSPRLVGRRELHAWISVTPAVRGTRQIRSAPAMRCALALAARRRPRPHTCSPPFAGEAVAIDRETRPLLPIRHPCPARAHHAHPISCSPARSQIQNNVGEGSTAATCVLGLKLRTLRVGAALLSPPSPMCPLKDAPRAERSSTS